MAAFRTIIYKAWTGVHFAWKWQREDHFLAARKFLQNLVGGPASPLDGDDFFLLEDEQQYDAAAAFRRKLLRADRGVAD